jgi:hypothetical protein
MEDVEESTGRAVHYADNCVADGASCAKITRGNQDADAERDCMTCMWGLKFRDPCDQFEP